MPTLLSALGVRHRDSLLTTHLEDMRKYMPPAHRHFIADRLSVRDFVVRHAGRLAAICTTPACAR